MLKEKIEIKVIKGKTFTILGRTFDTSLVELTPTGVGSSVLHEVGHLIHHTAIANAKKLFEQSKFKAALETARAATNQSSKRSNHGEQRRSEASLGAAERVSDCGGKVRAEWRR